MPLPPCIVGLDSGFDQDFANFLAALNNADEDDSPDQISSKEPDIDHDTVDKYILGPDCQHDREMWMQKVENSTTKENKSSKSDYIKNLNKKQGEDEAGQGKVPTFAKGALVDEQVLHQTRGVHSELKTPSTNIAPPTKNQDETPAKKKRF